MAGLLCVPGNQKLGADGGARDDLSRGWPAREDEAADALSTLDAMGTFFLRRPDAPSSRWAYEP